MAKFFVGTEEELQEGITKLKTLLQDALQNVKDNKEDLDLTIKGLQEFRYLFGKYIGVFKSARTRLCKKQRKQG